MKSTRRFIQTLTILIILTLLTPFNTFSEERHNEIRFGALLPLTGDLSSYGKTIRDGITLAVEDLAKDGISASVAYEDVPVPSIHAISAFLRLVNQQQVTAIVGNFWTPVIPMIAPYARQHKTLLLHTANVDDEMLKHQDTLITCAPKIADEAALIARHAYVNLGARTAAVISIATNFGESYRKHFVATFESLGGKIVADEQTSLDTQDLTTPLLKISQRSPDVIFAARFGTNLGSVLKQAGQLNIKSKFLSVYEAEDPSVVSVAGRDAEGVEFFVPEPQKENNESLQFLKNFKARFGYHPGVLARNAYINTRLASYAALTCKMDTSCLRNSILNSENKISIVGNFRFNQDGTGLREFVAKKIKDGEFVPLRSPF